MLVLPYHASIVHEEICSPTITAGAGLPELDAAFRERGLAADGNYGSLAGKVFRIGHMGSQADCELVREGMNVIRDVAGVPRKLQR